ncbi:hypothetical protein [Pedobacter agri]|uniref:Uncharacterized protein n=1 Tax=Pedobacter agri TaxID=454586 RepID=A0A9X3DBX7_9SPHI|nr:hypothetical protein [Pedobacter agri]MCX3264799.1 hypothetical protein [Pedobacter agri]
MERLTVCQVLFIIFFSTTLGVSLALGVGSVLDKFLPPSGPLTQAEKDMLYPVCPQCMIEIEMQEAMHGTVKKK